MNPLFLSRTALVVDDEEDLVELICEKLESWGFRTFGATRANEALAILRDHPIDVVLSDVRMPGASGMVLLDRVRFLSGRMMPAFVFITSHVDLEDEELIRRGADGYVEKPVNWKALETLLEKVIHKFNEAGLNAPRPLRLPALGQITIRSGAQTWTSDILSPMNISRGGFFGSMNSEAMPKLGDMIHFDLEVADHPELKLQGNASIRWVTKPGEEGEGRNGFGCQFVDTNAEDLERLLGLLVGSHITPRA